MKTIFLFLLLLLSAPACQKETLIPKPDPGEEVSYADHPRHVDYQAQLEAYWKSTHSPGAILLIHRKGEPLWVGAAGKSNLEHQASMRTNSQFRVGSITKVFVATAIMQLMEQGKLSLEDKLSDHLPKVRSGIPSSGKITIRHLLAHQSGICSPEYEF